MAPPTIKVGPKPITWYDPSRCYVMAMFDDRSLAMIANFARTDHPSCWEPISTAISENFNPGSSASTKDKTVRIRLFIRSPTKDDQAIAISRAYLKMIDSFTVFKISEAGIEGDLGLQELKENIFIVNYSPKYHYAIGDQGYIMSAIEG